MRKAHLLNDIEILYFFLSCLCSLKFIEYEIPDKIYYCLTHEKEAHKLILNRSEINAELSEILSDESEIVSNRVLSTAIDCEELLSMPAMKIICNIYLRLKSMDLPFEDQYNNLNIFKYLMYLFSETSENFEYFYAKYLFRLMKYCYSAKELLKAKNFCMKLEKFKGKIKNVDKFVMWKAKVYFRLGDYMQAIKVLRVQKEKSCKLKMFKYYLKSDFYSKNYVINLFQDFLKG